MSPHLSFKFPLETQLFIPSGLLRTGTWRWKGTGLDLHGERVLEPELESRSL